MDLDPKLIEQTAPGFLGALGALFFLRGPWLMRVGLTIPGMAAAFYAAPDVAAQFNMRPTLAGFAVGLLGMVVVDRVVEQWQKFEFGTIAAQWLRKLLGLKEGGES